MMGFAAVRQWVYPQSIRGRFQRLHRLSGAILLAILFATPWIEVGGHPALHIDLVDRRVYSFGAIFTTSDSILLLLILLFLAFSLFFFTSFWGRLWCGYACPQTVFLEELIRPIEQFIEGDRNVRMRRDNGPMTFDRAWRKGAKWVAFAAIAGLVAMGFMSYFAGARELWTGAAGPTEYALVGIFSAAMFLDFAWFREQFCIYLCPYARFQSAMTDDHTLQVMYDPRRGEPRGGREAKADGRCVECNLCVVVCPTGIDIRNGYQLECIGCARCVDACDHVMTKLGHETLVGYHTLAEVQGRPRQRVRKRQLVYGTLLSGIAAAAIAIVSAHVPFEATVNRVPGTLFTVDPDGMVRNTYMLHLTNNDPNPTPVPFTVTVEGLPDAEVVIADPDIRLKSTEDRTVPLVVRLPGGEHLGRTIPIQVRITTPSYERVVKTTFKTADQVTAAEGA